MSKKKEATQKPADDVDDGATPVASDSPSTPQRGDWVQLTSEVPIYANTTANVGKGKSNMGGSRILVLMIMPDPRTFDSSDTELLDEVVVNDGKVFFSPLWLGQTTVDRVDGSNIVLLNMDIGRSMDDTRSVLRQYLESHTYGEVKTELKDTISDGTISRLRSYSGIETRATKRRNAKSNPRRRVP